MGRRRAALSARRDEEDQLREKIGELRAKEEPVMKITKDMHALEVDAEVGKLHAAHNKEAAVQEAVVKESGDKKVADLMMVQKIKGYTGTEKGEQEMKVMEQSNGRVAERLKKKLGREKGMIDGKCKEMVEKGEADGAKAAAAEAGRRVREVREKCEEEHRISESMTSVRD